VRGGGAQDACGIMPGIQKLSYAGKNFDDASRTLEQCAPHHHHPHAALRSLGRNPCARLRATPSHARARAHAVRSYGVRYWHGKFPHWPLTIRRH
jgi:hypothetical protein